MATARVTGVVPDNSEYVALTNLSVSRARSDRRGGLGDDRMADRVEAGERVTLSDDEAHGFLTRHRVPVIRKANEQDSGRRITARDLFGRRTAPPATDKLQPTRGQTDVIDSAQLIQVDPALSPEGNPPDPSVVDPDAGNEGEKSTARGKAARES